MSVVAIWKGAEISNNASTETMTYRIVVGSSTGPVIHEGKVVRRPNDTRAKVQIGDICADYIRHALPQWNKEFDASGWGMTFYVQKPRMSHGVIVGWDTLGSAITFVNDWSYDEGVDYAGGLNRPISGYIDRRQMLLISEQASVASVTVVLHLADGTSINKVVTLKTTADFNDDYNEDYAIFETTPLEYGAVGILDLAEITQDVVAVSTPHHEYRIRENCGRYVLYYVNAYGGWDSLCVSAAEERKTYGRDTMEIRPETYAVTERTVFNYHNRMGQRWTLHTGTLTDEGGERMHHLVGSTFVLLHDLREGVILPVNVKDTECESKEYRNGRRRVDYTLNVEYARERERR